jgi:hypothetical protein
VEIDHDDTPEESRPVSSRWNRVPRDNAPEGHPNSRSEWFKRGHYISPDDAELAPENIGLDDRARRGLSDENNPPWFGARAVMAAIAKRGEAGGHHSEMLEEGRRIKAQDEAMRSRFRRLGDIMRGEAR